MRIPLFLGLFSGFVPAGTHLDTREAVTGKTKRSYPHKLERSQICDLFGVRP